ncbi:unnamed protein product, partial [Rotaria magnacalcarata]
ETILDLVKKAGNIIVIVDSCASRHGMMVKVLRFLERTQLPVYLTPMAKGGIDERHPQFRGIF